jgi:hypothetical protein
MFVALVIQHAKRMRCMIQYCRLLPAPLYQIIPHINDTNFEKVVEDKICVLISLQLLSATFLIFRRNQ